MVAKASLVTAALVSAAAASEYWYIPQDPTGSFCDGSVRPDWQECADNYIDWFINNDMHMGPNFLDGQKWTGKNCQVRYVQCTGSGYEWTQTAESGLFSLARNICEPLGGGGVQRQGDLCVIIEDPKNPFGDRPDRKVRDIEEDTSKVAARSHAKDMMVEEQKRDLVVESRDLQKRCEGSGDCWTYVQSNFAGNVRGLEQKVCDNILPDGASCAQSRAVTITDTYSASIDVSAGLKDIIDVGASFTTTYSEAVTTTLTTTITVDCDGGSGYIVWYPLMEVSQGNCAQGTCEATSQACNTNSLPTICRASKPIVPADGTLSGEYAVRCI